MSFYDSNQDQLLYDSYASVQKLLHDDSRGPPPLLAQNASLTHQMHASYGLARNSPALLRNQSSGSRGSPSHIVLPPNQIPIHPSTVPGSQPHLSSNSFHLAPHHINHTQPHSSPSSLLELRDLHPLHLPHSINQDSAPQHSTPQHPLSQRLIPQHSLSQHPLQPAPTILLRPAASSQPLPRSLATHDASSQTPEPPLKSRRVLLTLLTTTPSARPKRKNRPGKRFGAKKKSWVWSWFTQDSENHAIAACDFCGKVVVRIPSDKGSPKKLMEHLRLHGLSATSINYSRTDGVHDPDAASPASNFSHISTNSAPNSGGPSLVSDESNTSATSDLSDSRLSMILTNQVLPTFKPSPHLQCVNVPPRYISPQFDNTAYSPMKFYNHLLNFLRDHKLPLSTIQAHSFQQMVYDLRSDALKDILKLSEMYADILDMNRYTENE